MQTSPKIATRSYRATALLVALGALLLALVGMPREAAATFSGENGRIAFRSDRTTGEGVNNPTGDAEVFTMNPDGSGITQLTFNTVGDFDAVWSADGRKIAFDSFRTTSFDVFVMNADGSGQTNVTNHPAFDSAPAFSPDGQRIAFESDRTTGAGVDNPEGDTEIFTVNLDGTGLTQLTNNTARELHPDFSPGGKKIAFVSERDGNLEVYKMNADGSAQTRLTRNPASDESPGWSPGGRRIVFSTDRDGNDEVYTMKSDGSKKVRRTKNPATDRLPVFSPEGKHIAFISRRSGSFEVHRMRSDGRKQINLTAPGGGSAPDWQPL